jgi:predicted DNA binding protein
MTTFAVLRFPAEEIALADTIRHLPECRLRVEESAFSRSDASMHVWIDAPEKEQVTELLASDPSVSEYSLVREGDGGWLFALEFEPGIIVPRKIIQQRNGTVEKAVSSDGNWMLHVRFLDRSDLAAAKEDFDRYGIDVTYEAIKGVHDGEEAHLQTLTDDQRDVLETALEMGYFEVPREATLKEVAEEFDVSHQALSEQLRRAKSALVTEQLSSETPPTE